MPTAGPSAWVLLLSPSAPGEERAALLEAARELQPAASVASGDGWTAVALGDGVPDQEVARLRSSPAVSRAVEVDTPYRLAGRAVLEGDAEVVLGPEGRRRIGGGAPLVLAVSSPPAEGDERRLEALVARSAAAGIGLVHLGRVGLGLGTAASDADRMAILRAAAAAAHERGVSVSVEIDDARRIESSAETADLLQVAAGNMQDFSLLRELGRSDAPVLLRRGTGATVEEFLLAAEYVLSNGNGRVVLCESGIRTFDSGRRARFEVNAIPVLKASTHLPLMADPSTSVTHPALVGPVARAAVAAGADGLFLEVRESPSANGREPDDTSLDPAALDEMLAALAPVTAVMGRSG